MGRCSHGQQTGKLRSVQWLVRQHQRLHKRATYAQFVSITTQYAWNDDAASKDHYHNLALQADLAKTALLAEYQQQPQSSTQNTNKATWQDTIY